MKSSRGFTLIEVIVAMAVLGVACTALFSLLSRSLFNLRTIQDVHHYELAGEDVMRRIQFLSRLPPQGDVQGVIPEVGATWTASIKPWMPASLSERPVDAIMKIDVEVSWTGRAGRRTFHFESVKPATIAYENYDLQQAIDKAFPR